MKRNLAMLTLLALVLVTLFASFAGATFAPRTKVVDFDVQTPYFLINTVSDTVFSATVDNAATDKLYVIDENGTTVSVLRDNGQNGDVVAGDGNFYGTAALTSSEIGDAVYTLDVAGESAATSVRFYKELTDDDWADHDATFDKVFAIEDEGEAQKASDSEILNDVYSYLRSDKNVAKVWFETDTIINFELTSGIGCIFDRFSGDTKGSASAAVSSVGAPANLSTIETKGAEDYILSGNIGVWCPYYGSDSNFSYNYLNRANTLTDITGGEVSSFYGTSATIESFKTWGDYGVIMVDSHGSLYGGKSCICVPSPGSYDQTDISQGNLYSMGGGGVGVTGSFFSKYVEELPQSCIYFGICLGMATDYLWEPLVDIGAGTVTGYSESVTFRYDGLMMDSYFQYLNSTNTTTNDYYTTGEAYEAAKQANGDPDPWGGYDPAYYIIHGNEDLRILGLAVALESFEIVPQTTDLYINNTFALNLALTPENANRITKSFSSDNESIAVVDPQTGVVTAVDVGTATITCELVDSSDPENPALYTDTMTVNVLGSMPVSGIRIEPSEVETYLGASATALDTSVMPANATNQNIIWTSSDENVATVENGLINAVGGGTAVITGTTEDGGFSDTVTVYVRTLDEGLNVEGGTLTFLNSSTKPWVLDNSDSGRISARSNIAAQSSTTTTITLEAGALPVGSTLRFDWKVSSESNYDKLKFAVNGSSVSGIADISGESAWVTKTYTINQARDYTFTWTYSKDSSVNENSDCGWIDNVSISYPYTPTPTEVPPTPTPTQIPPTPTPTEVPPTPTPTSEPLLLEGDANLDGVVNTGDVSSILRVMVGLTEFNELQIANADVNGNGRVDTGDAAMLLERVLQF